MAELLYPNPAGGSMVVSSEQEARDAGWTPSMGTFGAYSQDANFQPADSGGGGGGGGGGGEPVQQMPTQQWQQDILNAFQAGSGFSIKQLEESKRQFDARLAFERDQMERIGIPQLAIEQRLAALQEEQFRAQHALAQRQQEFLEKMQIGQLDLSRAQLGFQYLTQAAQFAASDPFALSDFMRGAQTQTGVPQYLQNLQQNVTGAAVGTVGPEPKAATTLPMLSQALQGQGQPINPQTDAALSAIGGIYQRGPTQLGVGTLESLDQNELDTFNAGIRRLYGEAAVPAFLSAYQRSRPQQSAARTAYY